jgi:hypothetical protein
MRKRSAGQPSSVTASTTPSAIGLFAEATTAFRDEDKLSTRDRDYVQGIIDMMISKKS